MKDTEGYLKYYYNKISEMQKSLLEVQENKTLSKETKNVIVGIFNDEIRRFDQIVKDIKNDIDYVYDDSNSKKR